MAREEERKYDVAPTFVLPDLTTALPAGGAVRADAPRQLTATYYDTDDLRLARAGVSLRYRRGDEPPWTVKLPTDTPGVREEISRPGAPDLPPSALVALVTAYARGRPVRAVVTVQTHRRTYHLCDPDKTVLAEVADDDVTVPDGVEFREVEVERRDGEVEILDRVGELLVSAGARTGTFLAKHVRALGPAAQAPPTPLPPPRLGATSTARDLVASSLRRGVARLLAHDAPLRLHAALPGADTAVHQMRVACRRLRSDLRTFAPLVPRDWAAGLRDELRWLAHVLGPARDLEVLRGRLARSAVADPLAPCDSDAVARLDAALAERHRSALAAVDSALATARYTALLDTLVDAADQPRVTQLGHAAAGEVAPQLAAPPVAALQDGVAQLHPDTSDAQWHRVRVLTKRARYAVEAVAEVVGAPAPRLARRLAGVQDVLGEHQDAVVAAHTWLSLADTASGAGKDTSVVLTAGRLYERERAAVWGARHRFADVWHRVIRSRSATWLP